MSPACPACRRETAQRIEPDHDAFACDCGVTFREGAKYVERVCPACSGRGYIARTNTRCGACCGVGKVLIHPTNEGDVHVHA